jgi:hypothetical protein
LLSLLLLLVLLPCWLQVVAFEDTVAQVLEAGGPIAHATKADSVRLHDDKVRAAACNYRLQRLAALNTTRCEQQLTTIGYSI